ncbi:MAG TPA: pyridoxamine 5'-phosphate oxidase family protein [Mycobacterium sp.]
MSRNYGRIAFTDPVNDVQQRYSSREFYARHQARTHGPHGADALTPEVGQFLADRDGFYLATVGETGWPYVQFRGGPPGFLQVLDEHTLAWADFRGNLQYISTGNVAADDQVALFVMDYPHRRRLKIFGHARVVFAEDDPDLIERLTRPDYRRWSSGAS